PFVKRSRRNLLVCFPELFFLLPRFRSRTRIMKILSPFVKSRGKIFLKELCSLPYTERLT
ncbi:hypothetical protein, partial [uncultured Sutterella sp.]|uniref:hypothetical protein n=1 Tax=uncultured Sutterella sp. TaxID=286133 RepID=UPI00280B8F65